MKKFLIVATIIFIIVTSNITEFISDKIQSNDSYFTKIIDKDIYIANNNNKWEKLYIKGINMSSTKPGVYPNDDNITYEEYSRWISLIYEMGINCIRVSNLMGHDFYKALEEFNRNNEAPI